MAEIQQLQEDYNMDFGSSEESNNFLDVPNLAAAMKMLEMRLQVMMIPVVKRILGQEMENMVRKVVKEEFEHAQERFFTWEKMNCGIEGHGTQLRKLELQFLEQVPDVVYTGKEIEVGGGGNHLMIELVDPLTGSRVSSGPEASAKIELSVLYKDDVDDDIDGQSKQEESEDIGKPVLTRDHVKLKDGIAILDNVKFKQKSKWTKTCSVILMATANINGIIVKEAQTEPFLVRDCRTNLYKKRYPPSLSDEVFRLKDISRGSPRHKRLLDAKIYTVAEFLRLLNMNPQRLKQILKVSAEKYKVITDHAKKCPIGENLYMYNSNSTQCGREVSAIFNVIGCLQGLLYSDKYVSINNLSDNEKVDAYKIMTSAFLDFDNAKSIENESSVAYFMSQSTENGNKLFPQNEDGELFENGDSSTQLANVSNSPSNENAEDDETFTTNIVAPGSSDAIDTNSSNTSRTDNFTGNNNLSIWRMIDESDNASTSTMSRHLSPVHSFGRDPFIFLPDNNMDIIGHGIDYPIHSRTVSEEFDEQLQLFIEEHCYKRAATSDNYQMTGNNHVLSSSTTMACRRWKMAIRIVALGNMQARKKRRLK